MLNKEIDAQKDKISALEAALANSAESFGENDKRTQNWQIQLYKTQAELNGMERELDSTTKALDGTGSGFDEAGKGADPRFRLPVQQQPRQHLPTAQEVR